MNFNKTDWRKVEFGDICYDIEYGITASAEESGNTILLRITDIDENGKIADKLKFTSLDEKSFKKYELFQDDVLIARSGATAGKPYLHKLTDRSVFASYLLRLQLNKEKVFPEFVFNFLFSPSYLQQLRRIKIGGAQPNVNTTNLRTLKIPLPPLEEQARIVELFQIIDYSIEQNDEQEKNLQALAKRLIEGLISDKPIFGKLLEDNELKPIKFADIVECIEHHERQPLSLGLTHLIGLENIEPENFRISTWGILLMEQLSPKHLQKAMFCLASVVHI